MRDDEVTVFPPFTVTKAAVEAIVALGGAVRLDLEEGGCCGTTYSFALADPDVMPEPDETRYGCPGAWLVIGAEAASVMPGATLDYGARLRPARFRVIKNPNVAEVCTCRRSFGNVWPGPGQPTCRSYAPMPWDDQYDPPTRWKKQTGYDEGRN